MNANIKIKSILEGKKSILAVIAHPDDFEDYFSGTMLIALEKGWIKPEYIHLLIVTDGSSGSRGKIVDPKVLKKMRFDEQMKALDAVAIPRENCHFLDFKDGYVHNNDNRLTERVAYYIRKLKPDLLLTHNGFEAIIERESGMYYVHKDHRMVGQAALDACYPYSRDLLFFPEHHKEGLNGHFLLEVLVAETQNPNVKVDITKKMPEKIGLLKNFMSQIESDEWLYNYFKDTTGEAGRYLEAFKYVKIII
ncbi:PIG-L family deacetylase [Candidatus Woesebacteria bacterium]|nr:PIG-L family deacetylase [Candidatus Woesebacteria bacterium]